MDLNILQWVNTTMHSDQLLNEVWKFITSTADIGFIWIILCAIFFLNKDTRKIGIIMILSFGLNFFVVDIVLKHIITRPRPFTILPELAEFITSVGYELPTSYSFPSGHSSISLAVAFALFMSNKKLGTPALIWAFLVAISRVYMCVHYPTDVLAGIMIGIIVAVNVHIYYDIFTNRYIKKTKNQIRLSPMLKHGVV